MKQQKITFDDKSIHLVLKAIGFGVNKDGYVTSIDNLTKDLDGNPFKPEDIIGIIDKGFITKASQILELS